MSTNFIELRHSCELFTHFFKKYSFCQKENLWLKSHNQLLNLGLSFYYKVYALSSTGFEPVTLSV